jgi:hypothetical protein
MAKNPVYEGRDLEALSEMPKYYDWILSHFRPYLKGTCAEFGAGKGNFSVFVHDLVDRLIVIEPSPNLAAELEEMRSNYDRLEVLEMPLESAVRTIPGATLDCAVMVNVLEHIQDDVSALQAVRCLIIVPAMQWLYSRFDNAVGHHRRYHLEPLSALMRGAGFELVVARYFDLMGVVPWLVVNKILRRTELDPRMTSLYDLHAVPVGRFIEERIKPPIGKNIVAIGRA